MHSSIKTQTHHDHDVILKIQMRYTSQSAIEHIWLSNEANMYVSKMQFLQFTAPKSTRTWGFGNPGVWIMFWSSVGNGIHSCFILFTILEFILNDDHLIWLIQGIYIFLRNPWMWLTTSFPHFYFQGAAFTDAKMCLIMRQVSVLIS